MKISKIFDIVQKVLLITFIAIIIISSIVSIKQKYSEVAEKEYMKISIIYIMALIISVVILLSKINNKKKILLFFFIGFIIRAIWVITIPTKLVSDYKTIYDSAVLFLQGDVSAVRDFGYLARFPHLIPMMLYMSSVICIFPISHLIVMKIINIGLAMLTMFLIYKLSDYFVNDEKTKNIVVLFSTLNVPFIAYVSTFCTENIAIPLFLYTILILLRTLKWEKKQLIGIIFTGMMLSISNLYRAVGVIFLIAFVLYILFYTEKNKIKNSIILVLAYLLMNVVISFSLIGLGVIENPLWKGSEPKITSVLRGTSISTYGMWNMEDSIFVSENLENLQLSKMCVDKIKGRLSNLSFAELIKFYCMKFAYQWGMGDNSGVYWATSELNVNASILSAFEIFSWIGAVLSAISLFKQNKKEVKLLYIILLGIICLFLIIEAQSRYSYIVSWVFIFLASLGIENIGEKIKIIKQKLLK